jgi:hypothetical protein
LALSTVILDESACAAAPANSTLEHVWTITCSLTTHTSSRTTLPVAAKLPVAACWRTARPGRDVIDGSRVQLTHRYVYRRQISIPCMWFRWHSSTVHRIAMDSCTALQWLHSSCSTGQIIRAEHGQSSVSVIATEPGHASATLKCLSPSDWHSSNLNLTQ